MITQAVEQGFAYNAGNNERFQNDEETKQMIRLNVDKNFEPK